MAERPLAVLAYDASCRAKSSGAAEADRWDGTGR